MLSVAASHTSRTSARSKKSPNHDKTRSERSKDKSKAPDVIEKLVVKTVDIQLDPSSVIKTGSPRPDVPNEVLTFMMGGPSRRSRCAPEFLVDVAKRSPLEILEEFGKKFKIVTGSEAVAFYKKFLGGKGAAEHLAAKENTLAGKNSSPHIVFAVTVVDAGRKLVDYYTTWHGKMSPRDLTQRKLKLLDSQFRKTARVLDSQFKRIRIYGGTAGSTKSSRSRKDSQEPHESNAAKFRPPAIQLPPPELKVDAPTSPPLRTPLSATDSVMSLPFLNMIRGVPVGHRVPLTVTNPDRFSMISSIDANIKDSPATRSIKGTTPNVLPSIAEVETRRDPTPSATKLLTPKGMRANDRHSLRSSNSKDSNNSSAASTASTESRRSKHKEKETQEFTIVLLDENTDKDNRTWHGLERQVSRSSTRTSTSRVSLWDGPLARGNGIKLSTKPSTPREENSSEDDDDWDSPVIPPPPGTFHMARALSESRRYPTAAAPPAAQYRMTNTNTTSMPPFVNVNLSSYAPSPISAPASYLPSPYMQSYALPYQSPVMAPNLRPSPRSRYEPFHP